MPPIPSRQALRYLTYICRIPTETTALATFSAGKARSVHHRNLHTKTCRLTPPRVQCTERIRQFNTSIAHQAEPAGEIRPDPDPQNTATAKLPDITNYYTLFPSTLPNGPPGPAPLTQPESPSPTAITSATANESQDTGKQSRSQFDIHTPTLRREFLKLQATHHPDKFSPSTPAHQKSLALSSLINTAYKTLSDPLLRAQYLLQLQHNVDVTSEDNAAFPTDQETLMEVMEVQERVEEAKSRDEVDEMKEENDERIRIAVSQIGEAFERGNVDAAVAETVRLKYWRSVKQGLDDWEEGKEVRLVH